jgi:hypothetical protein
MRRKEKMHTCNRKLVIKVEPGLELMGGLQDNEEIDGALAE